MPSQTSVESRFLQMHARERLEKYENFFNSPPFIRPIALAAERAAKEGITVTDANLRFILATLPTTGFPDKTTRQITAMMAKKTAEIEQFLEASRNQLGTQNWPNYLEPVRELGDAFNDIPAVFKYIGDQYDHRKYRLGGGFRKGLPPELELPLSYPNWITQRLSRNESKLLKSASEVIREARARTKAANAHNRTVIKRWFIPTTSSLISIPQGK